MKKTEDFLDELKGAWKGAKNDKVFSAEAIFAMLKRKSGNSVKWILIISSIELILGVLGTISFMFPSNKEAGSTVEWFLDSDFPVFQSFNIVNLLVTLGFVFFFFRGYRKIKISESVKGLIRDILNFRRVAHYYILYNILVFLLVVVPFFFLVLDSDLFLRKYLEREDAVILTRDAQEKLLTIFFWLKIGFVIFMLVALLGYYRLVYGILLNRLKRNHKSLEDIQD